MKAAYTTLLTREAYLPGTLVLNHSLRSVGSNYELVVMVTPSLPRQARDVLSKEGIRMRDILRLDPEEGMHKLTAHDGRFGDTWTKLRAFELVEYDRVVLIDSDMLVLRNMDDLFNYELPGPDWIAAANVCACNPRKLAHYPADWIPQNCAYTPLESDGDTVPPPVEITSTSPRPYTQLNSGTVLLQPSEALSLGLYRFLATSPLVPTFTFPDQDLLSHYFKGKWRALPYVYNALKTLRIIHTTLWRDKDVRCLHYILDDKPWKQPPGSGGDYETVNGWWWDSYDELKGRLRDTDTQSWKLIETQVKL